MFLLYHAYIYLELLILTCTIYILAPQLVPSLRWRQREGYEALKARGEWDKLGRPVKMTQEEFLNKWDQKGKNVTDKEFAESLNISKGTLQSYKKKYLKGKK